MFRGIEVDDVLSQFTSPDLLSDEGGQKIVYTVILPKYGKSVLKIGSYDSPKRLERINREVGILRELKSEYFPKNYDFKVVDADRYFILEEFLNGGTLKDYITSYSQEHEAVNLIKELINGLRILWNKRIVHRDLKPQNIIITPTGPRIIDLGIARLLDATSLTETYAPFGPGTPAYASPEQIENRKREIDFRSDQFNLGIIFAQLVLGGLHPFSSQAVGNNNSILENILEGQWASSQVAQIVSPPTYTVISRLLGHEPYERYRKADELQNAVRKLQRQ